MAISGDIGKYDELYLVNPKGELIKMDDNEHHLEYLLSYYPGEANYDEDFWDMTFKDGWIRIELKKNYRDGWDLMLNGSSLSKMKKIVRGHFLSRIKYGENKIHIEERTDTFHHPVHIFYLPQQKEEFYDFILESWKKKLVPESLNELQQFNRQGKPLEKMGIGHEAQLQKMDKENDWGFELSHAFHSKIWDIVKYKGYLIKIMEIWGSDEILSYMALTNSGEPYATTPALHPSPEQALEPEKKFIDQEMPA